MSCPSNFFKTASDSTHSGINGGEFYDDNYQDHHELPLGGLGLLLGQNEVVATVLDPETGGSQGFEWYSNSTGIQNKGFTVFTSASGLQGKAGGLGDLEFLCASAPLEIGNYVWEDTDEDGIQDACEPALGNVIVTLYNTTCEIIAIDTTDNKGEYYFNETKLREYTTQTDSILSPNTTYYVVVTDAVGGTWTTADSTLTIGVNTYNLTSNNQGSNDLIDSDATKGTAASACNSVTNGYAFATATTSDAGCVDHSFDIGFRPQNLNYDYGDLPDIANGTTGINDYETYDSTGGPSHQIITGLFLGDTVDVDNDGFPNADALGDDNDNVDDEDGVSILASLNPIPAGTIRLPLSVTNFTGDTAYVEAWIDWNGDGDFDLVNELVADLKDNKDGVFPAYLTIPIPNTATTGSLLGFRIRLSNTDNMTPYGRVNSGEVEDYLLGIDCPQMICLPIEVELKRE